MNKVLGIIVAIIASGIFFIIGKAVGGFYVGFLKTTDGMVTAKDVVEAEYIIPFLFAFLGAYAAYKVQTKDE